MDKDSESEINIENSKSGSKDEVTNSEDDLIEEVENTAKSIMDYELHQYKLHHQYNNILDANKDFLMKIKCLKKQSTNYEIASSIYIVLALLGLFSGIYFMKMMKSMNFVSLSSFLSEVLQVNFLN